MKGNREGGAKTFPKFRASTKYRESKAKTFLTFKFSTKCREIGKAWRRLPLRFGSAITVGKKAEQGEDFPYV